MSVIPQRHVPRHNAKFRSSAHFVEERGTKDHRLSDDDRSTAMDSLDLAEMSDNK